MFYFLKPTINCFLLVFLQLLKQIQKLSKVLNNCVKSKGYKTKLSLYHRFYINHDFLDSFHLLISWYHLVDTWYHLVDKEGNNYIYKCSKSQARILFCILWSGGGGVIFSFFSNLLKKVFFLFVFFAV